MATLATRRALLGTALALSAAPALAASVTDGAALKRIEAECRAAYGQYDVAVAALDDLIRPGTEAELAACDAAEERFKAARQALFDYAPRDAKELHLKVSLVAEFYTDGVESHAFEVIADDVARLAEAS